VLVALGRPEAALTLLRARTKSSFSAKKSTTANSKSNSTTFDLRLDEALTGLSARLECGLLSEAFTEARAAAARAAPVGSKEHNTAVGALTVALARWAADNGELPSVALFPLSSIEEKALLGWLASAAGSETGGRSDAVLQTVLFHLQRGRAPEALLAASRAEGGKLVKGGNVAPATAAAEAGALELLRQSARSLPSAQRALLLSSAEGGGGGSAPSSLSPFLSSLRLLAPGEPVPPAGGAERLVREGLAEDLPAARLLVSAAGGSALPPPLLASLTSEAWMETRAGAGGGGNGGFFEAQEEKAGERERGREKQQRPPRTRATAAAATPGWKSSSAAAAAAAPSANGFLAPVEALAATTKRARLRQRG